MSDDTTSGNTPKPTDLVILEFGQNTTVDDEKKLRNGLSAIVQVGNTLWLANDEAVSLDRLTVQPGNGDGAHRFGNHTRFALVDYLRLSVPPLPGKPPIVESDVEGLDYRDGFLWLVGSHSRKREQPKKDKPEKGFNRLAEVTSDGNRFLLARIPLIEDSGACTLQQSAVQDGKELVAAQLPCISVADELLAALQDDEHLAPFLAIPGEDNGFDIEGLAVQGNRLFIGLRGPVLRSWAIILEVEPEEDPTDRSILKLKAIGPDGRPYRKHFFQLGGLGIRDLCVQAGDLLILAGPTMDLDGPVSLFRWRGGAQPGAESLVFDTDPNLKCLFDVPYGQGINRGKNHAEGMTLFANEEHAGSSVLIVYDSIVGDRLRGDYGVAVDVFSLPTQ